MDKLLLGVVVALGALIVAPAVIAGGGWLIVGILLLVLVAGALGVPYFADLYKQIRMGERSGLSSRDMIQGNGYDPDADRRDRP